MRWRPWRWLADSATRSTRARSASTATARAAGSARRPPRAPSAVAFMVLVGACAVTPADQMRYATAIVAARRRRIGEREVERALATRAAVDAATRGDMDRGEAAAQVRGRGGRAVVRSWPSSRRYRTTAMARPASGAWRWTTTSRRLLARLDDAGAADPRRARPLDAHRGQPGACGATPIRDRPQRLTAVRLPGTGHFPTMARGAAGERRRRPCRPITRRCCCAGSASWHRQFDRHLNRR